MIFRLWLAALFLILIAALSACQPQSNTTLTPATPSVEPSPEATEAVAVSPEWIEARANGVEIGMWKPAGWSFDATSGVTILQNNPWPGNPHSPETGIIVNIFSPSLEHYDMPEAPEDINDALWILEYIVSAPGVIAPTSVASAPQPFEWNGYDAAYYLLTGRHNKRAIVICVLVDDQYIGINIAMPDNLAEDARSMIPQLFNDFTAAGVRLGGDDLAMLPDPLVFPEKDTERTPEQNSG